MSHRFSISQFSNSGYQLQIKAGSHSRLDAVPDVVPLTFCKHRHYSIIMDAQTV